MTSAVPAAVRRVPVPLRIAGVALAAYAILVLALMWWWDEEPDPFDVVAIADVHAREHGHRMVTGTVTVATLIHTVDVLLEKRGGYLANDITPPGLIMDNIPSWEKGVVQQVRDLSQALRNDFSRSQSQSAEDADLREALNRFSAQRDKWILPSAESQYREGQRLTEAFLQRLGDDTDGNAQFFARADNLVNYLRLVEKQLGSLSQQLSASVGQERLNTDLANDPNAQQSTPAPEERLIKTPWLQIDNVFYEARGSTWALMHFLQAIEHDFEPVLRDKNALVSLRQIIRELEESQASVLSPIILNGRQFGFFANHSLVLANYISRANAAIIDLRELLQRG
jgi:hypothetical protein